MAGSWKDRAIAFLCALLLAMMTSHYMQSERSAKLEVRVATLTERSKARFDANKDLRKTQAAMVGKLSSIDRSLGEINVTLVYFRDGFSRQRVLQDRTTETVAAHSKTLDRLMLLSGGSG